MPFPGYIRDVRFRNITMLGETHQAILVSMHYSNNIGPTNKTATPQFSNIFFDDISIAAADSPGGFVGLPESRIENIHLNNVHVRKSGSGWQCQDVDTKSSGATDVTPPSTCL